MSTMLPFGITTLVWPSRAGQALAFTRVHGVLLYVSSPKYHAHPVGEPVEVSLNSTVSGAAPLITLLVKFASGTAPAVPTSSERAAINRNSTTAGVLLERFAIE